MKKPFRSARLRWIALGVIALIATPMCIAAYSGSFLGFVYSGPRLDGCGYQRIARYTDSTTRIYVEKCLPPGFPASVPILSDQIANSYVERGENGYERFDVVVRTPETVGSPGEIAEQLSTSGFTDAHSATAATNQQTFSNGAWLVFMSYWADGPHGPTAEYFVSPAPQHS